MNGKILIVEDDPLIGRMYENVLSHEGFQTSRALDGAEALEQLVKEPKPNLILLDLMMPKVNGLQVLRKLQENSELSQIPVIVLTNNDSPEALQEAKKSGVYYYLVKSNFEPDEVVRIIKQRLGIAFT